MMKKSFATGLLLLSIAVLPASSAISQDAEQIARADKGIEIQMGREPGWFYQEHKKMSAALAALKPQRKGIVDAYVVVAGIDSDDVFGREAAETAKVLSQRYDAVGRTVILSAGTGAKSQTAPFGSISNLSIALAGVAAKMDLKEDVLILYTTSHGAPGIGIVFNDKESGFGMISPTRMAATLNGMGFTRRLVMISACYSGAFVPSLQSPDSIIITAASAERSSFGCHPGNDWTFFGDALINGTMRTPVPLDTAVKDAFKTISGWETKFGLKPSEPQFSVGSKTNVWLSLLEKRMPKTTSARVGKPAIEGL
jgi:hypothetical protein